MTALPLNLLPAVNQLSGSAIQQSVDLTDTASLESGGSSGEFSEALEQVVYQETSEELPKVALLVETDEHAPLAMLSTIQDDSDMDLFSAAEVQSLSQEVVSDEAQLMSISGNEVTDVELTQADASSVDNSHFVLTASADKTVEENTPLPTVSVFESDALDVSDSELSLEQTQSIALLENHSKTIVDDGQPAKTRTQSSREAEVPALAANISPTSPGSSQKGVTNEPVVESVNSKYDQAVKGPQSSVGQPLSTETGKINLVNDSTFDEHITGKNTATEQSPSVENSEGQDNTLPELQGIKTPVSISHSTRPIQVQLPVGQSGWGQQFNEQILWLGSRQIQSATINLNPAELGPVEVNINMNNDTASIQINSHNPQVKDLIEQALPRLRDMMQEQGINLGDVEVGANNQQQMTFNQSENQQRTDDQNTFGQQLSDEEDTSVVAVSTIVNGQVQTGIDYFA